MSVQTVNIFRRRVSLEQYVSSHVSCRYFWLGFQEKMLDKPFREFDIERNQIHYEKGRFFATWCKRMKMPRAVFRNGKPAKTLVERVRQAALNRVF